METIYPEDENVKDIIKLCTICGQGTMFNNKIILAREYICNKCQYNIHDSKICEKDDEQCSCIIF